MFDGFDGCASLESVQVSNFVAVSSSFELQVPSFQFRGRKIDVRVLCARFLVKLGLYASQLPLTTQVVVELVA